MRLDPEEQIIAAAFEQAELDDANERGVVARIEFRPEGPREGDFHHFARVRGDGQGARLDDRGIRRRGDRGSHPPAHST